MMIEHSPPVLTRVAIACKPSCSSHVPKSCKVSVSILVSLLYSREAELQKAAAGVIFPTGLDAEKLKSSASDRKKRLEDAQRFLAMTARPKPLDPASAEKEFDALFGGDIAETDDDDPNRSDKEALMPDYYIAEDGTIHDREAEHRSRTQHTAAPAVADTTAEDTPEVSFARQFVYWLFALSASVFAAVCVFHEMQAAFTPPAHLDFLEDYVQQFVFEHAKALVITLTVFCIYLYGKTGAKKHRYNVLAYLCTVSICCFAPPAAVFVLMAAPILMALALAVLVLGIIGLVKMAFG